MESVSDAIISKVIAGSPHLETLVIGEEKNAAPYCRHRPEGWFSRPCSRLTTLSLSNLLLHIDDLQSGLSSMPYLRHLKIINCTLKMIDGFRWEDLINSTLPALDKFEFYAILTQDEPEGDTDTCVLYRMIAPFRTPFWTEDKQWRVICNWFPNGQTLEMYTSPICTSSYTDVAGPKVMTISSFERKDQRSTTLETVDEFHVNIFRILSNDQVGTIHLPLSRHECTDQRYPSKSFLVSD